ncbi:MAG: porin [Gemmatimonadetes bacterium]|nr:porin [Gemmatimonadota bacterium]
MKPLLPSLAMLLVVPVVARTQAGQAQPSAPAAWYQKLSMRGYLQLRASEVLPHDGLALEVPSDRSVNGTESIMIRRGRLVLSGDASSRLSIYAQLELAGSTGSGDFAAQTRDLYADLSFDAKKDFRLRLGQSKVPYGFVNLQSSQNRAPLERPEGINSAVEGERDIGAFFMWAPAAKRAMFREITTLGLKGTGDYGVLAIGAYSGQGLNRPDQNGDPHVVARLTQPIKLASGQFAELAVQAYKGNFVSTTQAIAAGTGGANITPAIRPRGVADERVGVTAVWYPQPFGVEAEWNVGRGPALSADSRNIESASLRGGYVQLNYRHKRANATTVMFPFTRWNYYDGGRKFARNAPMTKVNEMDFGLEFSPWADAEFTAVFTRTIERTRTSAYPYAATKDANRIGLQVQWNF